ncbi:MAG: UDP-N-acetylmuramoyl-L-alanyl-D-glutamate--2,6-diaminopimelate ligase [Holosporales bacterium]|nr:UDP-N-acetylmuramoyl-L-alanyl-D-glutamate--2,6-diaminopimelate ligase [Holosporales bacterium]
MLPIQEITNLTADSRKVEKNGVFAALPGVVQNGVDYIPQAIAGGAALIVISYDDFARFSGCAKSYQASSVIASHGVQFLLTKELPTLFAQMAAAFYGTIPDVCIAVTGTNGKSSVVDFTRQIWALLGYKAVSIGTLGIKEAQDTPLEGIKGLTTPDPVQLHTLLAQLVTEKSITHCALEASSHGLAQRRLDGMRFTAAAFTQLSQDHLDYHRTMETYFSAKKHLFKELVIPQGTCVLNADVPEYAELSRIARIRSLQVLDYGKKAQALVLKNLKPDTQGQKIHATILGQQVHWYLPLIGNFQAYNFLCALGLLLACGTKRDMLLDLFTHFESLPIRGVPGRLECIAQSGKTVYIDYAHTPDALKNVLAAIRPHTKGRIILVLGCGGNRDSSKRPLMGKIAEQFSDRVFITDDNPRHEDSAKIRRDIRAGMTEHMQICEIADRYEAIASALAEAAPCDVVVIVGKGHETTQLIQGVYYPFSDQKAVREILKG